MATAAAVRAELSSKGAAALPTWEDALAGARAPQEEDDREDDEFDIAYGRGWQRHACSAYETTHKEHCVLPLCGPARRALLLSQASGAASAFLRALPSERGFQMTPLRFITALRRRLRWPLPLCVGRCRGRYCRGHLDRLGDHATSCPRSGLLKLRARPLERTWARVLREVGARVRENVYVRDAGIPEVDPTVGRRIEVVATGLPSFNGVPLAVDATLVSPLPVDGTPQPGADEHAKKDA